MSHQKLLMILRHIVKVLMILRHSESESINDTKTHIDSESESSNDTKTHSESINDTKTDSESIKHTRTHGDSESINGSTHLLHWPGSKDESVNQSGDSLLYLPIL